MPHDLPPVPEGFEAEALEHDNDFLIDLYGVSRSTINAWRKATRAHRRRGLRRLPPYNADVGDLTIGELAAVYGWGSYCRFQQALRAARPAVYEQARRNGIHKRVAGRRKAVQP